MRHVLIAQSMIKEYRIPFYDGLYAALNREGVKLTLAYGEPPPSEAKKKDNVTPDPAYGLCIPSRWLLNERFLWQPLLPLARNASMVIVEQANKHLANPLLLARSRMGRGCVAFWGQGRNVHTDENSLRERVKAKMLHLPDWWFAYTQGVADFLVERGVSRDIVTVVQNAIDTRVLRSELASVTDEQVKQGRARLGIGESDPVGIFCGSLFPGKRIDILLDAALEVRKQVPNFHLLVVGAGSESERLLAAGQPWIHVVGRQTGMEKALSFRIADLFLIPAWVGLAVVDAFAAGLPVVTTDLPLSHSVEIEYVEHDKNGLIAPADPAGYARGIVELLRDPERHRRLAKGAIDAANRYTMETMVANFANGIVHCLDYHDRKRQGGRAPVREERPGARQ